MCTLTLVRLPARRGVRLGFTRDELLSRPNAEPPSLRHFGLRQALLPIDPASGGTWLGVNDAGLAVGLLNVNERPATSHKAQRSRGVIVPMFLRRGSLESALAQAHTLCPGEFAPFRLVFADRETWASVRSDGRQLSATSPESLSRPLLFTSSGLGDAVVEQPRRELFEEMLLREAEPSYRQEEFHRHCWPEAQSVSVRMARTDAQTVSFTTITLTPTRAMLRYEPLAGLQPEVHELPLATLAGGFLC
jgi:uncharacterized protein with NRDE domain